MQSLVPLLAILLCLPSVSHAQRPDDDEWDAPALPKFELSALASGMNSIDATGTVIIRNPQPNQPSPFTPMGFASGARFGFAWRQENAALFADFGFHKFADRSGCTSMAPLMVGIRIYSRERFRTSFFGEAAGGAYRWTVNSGNVNFATVKGIVSGSGGMDVRLTHRLAWRVFEIRLAIAGAQNGPQLTGGSSTGIAYRFGDR